RGELVEKRADRPARSIGLTFVKSIREDLGRGFTFIARAEWTGWVEVRQRRLGASQRMRAIFTLRRDGHPLSAARCESVVGHATDHTASLRIAIICREFAFVSNCIMRPDDCLTSGVSTMAIDSILGVGSGTMGRGIAQVAATCGLKTYLHYAA